VSTERPHEVRVCPADDLGDGQVRSFHVAGRRIAVARLAQRLVGFGGACPHQGHDLGAGFLWDGGVTCPTHLWHFDLASGRCTQVPGASIPIYAARELDGWVVVALPE